MRYFLFLPLLFILINPAQAKSYIYNYEAVYSHRSDETTPDYSAALHDTAKKIFDPISNQLLIVRTSPIQIRQVPSIQIYGIVSASAMFQVTIEDAPEIFVIKAAENYIKSPFASGSRVYEDIVLQHQSIAYPYLINNLTSWPVAQGTATILQKFNIHREEIRDGMTTAFYNAVGTPEDAIQYLYTLLFLFRSGVPTSQKTDDAILYAYTSHPSFMSPLFGLTEYHSGDKKELIDELLIGLNKYVNMYFTPNETLSISSSWFKAFIDKYPPSENAQRNIAAHLNSVLHPEIKEIFNYALAAPLHK